MTDETIKEELSQTRARVVISLLTFVGFGGTYLLQPELRHGTLLHTVFLISGYAALSCGWYFMIRRHPDRWLSRRYFTILADIAVVTISMFLADRVGAYAYPLYLWVIVGNGLRFGPRHLLFGVINGLLGFGALLLISPYWHNRLEIGVGLLAGILVLPLFYLTVLRRVQQLNARLKIELQRSQVAEKAKGDFLANMSHEIRTPLNGILGLAEIIGDSELKPGQAADLDLIVRSGESLLNIINDILDYSKIASGRLTIEAIPFNLEQVLLDVYLLLKPTADEKGVSLFKSITPATPACFVGDPTRIRQILFNLVGNAIKFTEQGKVEIQVDSKPHDGAPHLVLAVQDTGIGIPADRLEAIFDQFEQAASATTRHFGGTGLGLAICRLLARQMGGDLHVSSRLGDGSRFVVDLPLPRAIEPVTKPVMPQANVRFDLKALVAEDNPINQLVIAKQLERLGISCTVVDNGQEALRTLDDSYDVVFLDTRMPVLGGLETVALIRRRKDDLARIPVVCLTADAGAQDAARSLAAGMDLHLSKPLNSEDLVQALSGGLGFAVQEAPDTARPAERPCRPMPGPPMPAGRFTYPR